MPIYQVVIEANLRHGAGPIHPQQGRDLGMSRVRTQQVSTTLLVADSISAAERAATARYQTTLPDPPIGHWVIEASAEPISRKRIKAILRKDTRRCTDVE